MATQSKQSLLVCQLSEQYKDLILKDLNLLISENRNFSSEESKKLNHEQMHLAERTQYEAIRLELSNAITQWKNDLIERISLELSDEEHYLEEKEQVEKSIKQIQDRNQLAENELKISNEKQNEMREILEKIFAAITKNIEFLKNEIKNIEDAINTHNMNSQSKLKQTISSVLQENFETDGENIILTVENQTVKISIEKIAEMASKKIINEGSDDTPYSNLQKKIGEVIGDQIKEQNANLSLTSINSASNIVSKTIFENIVSFLNNIFGIRRVLNEELNLSKENLKGLEGLQDKIGSKIVEKADNLDSLFEDLNEIEKKHTADKTPKNNHDLDSLFEDTSSDCNKMCDSVKDLDRYTTAMLALSQKNLAPSATPANDATYSDTFQTEAKSSAP